MEVQRVTHEILAFADLDDSSAKTSHVINRGLQRAIVGPDDVRVGMTYANARQLLHR
jgi:hypothetical protein